MKKVVIFGVGDFARVARVYLEKDSPHEVAAFAAHRQFIKEETLLGLPVVAFETLERTYPPAQYSMLVAVGYSRVNKARAEIYAQCKAKGYELISYCSTKTVCVGGLKMGDNCFIFENNVIQPFVTIGNDVVLWSGNHVGHDAKIGDHVFIASHAVISGRVEIGDYCFVGVNATFADGVKIGASCVIGAGAAMLKDAEPGGVYGATQTERSRVPSSRLRGL